MAVINKRGSWLHSLRVPTLGSLSGICVTANYSAAVGEKSHLQPLLRYPVVHAPELMPIIAWCGQVRPGPSGLADRNELISAIIVGATATGSVAAE